MSTEPELSDIAASELGEDQRLGGTPAAAAANAAVRALSRAARSFLIYEPHNEAIRIFLTAYQSAMTEALTFGTLDLDVRPFELVRGGEVVYLERDRDRSLAFRLFRDGVRTLSVQADVPWEELLKLLEILSIRYTGVRQQEDDIVTLLWKAGFSKITVGAVEGFVPDEADDAGLGSSEVYRTSLGHTIPAGWDLPLPEPLRTGKVMYFAVPDEHLAGIRHEAAHGLPSLCLRLVRRLVRAVHDPLDPTSLVDILPVVEEIRDFFLSGGQPHWLAALLDILSELPAADQDRLFRSFADSAALTRIVRSFSRGVDDAPAELTALLERLPGDHLSSLMRLYLMEAQNTGHRRVLRGLIGHFAATRPGPLVQAIAAAPSELARDLLQLCFAIAPDAAPAAALCRVGDADPATRAVVLQILGGATSSPEVTEALAQLFEESSGDLRLQVIAVIVARDERVLFDALAERLERSGLAGVPDPEAEQIGLALARLAPAQAAAVFARWLAPRGFLGRFIPMPGQRSQWWAAVAGFPLIPSPEAEGLIRGVIDHVDAPFRRHCLHALVRLRHAAKPVAHE